MYLSDDRTPSELAWRITRRIAGDWANDTATLKRACVGGADALVSGGGRTPPRSGEFEQHRYTSTRIEARWIIDSSSIVHGGLEDMDDLRLAFQQLRKFEIAGGTHTTLSFVPEAGLFELLTHRTIATALEDPVFGFESHQRGPVSVEVTDGARKLFAILVELRIEQRLKTCLEKNLSDSNLPILGENILHGLFPESATHFFKLQWEFVPLKLREHTHKDIESERVLPFVVNEKISSGGFSTVFKVKVHPLYHDFEPCSGEQQYVRKEISHRSSYEAQRRESDLLFLLRSLENDNLVRIVTSYAQSGLCNLLFPIADCDLHDLMLNESQPKWCQDSAQVVDSFRGLANGLHYLHNFRPLIKNKEEAERITRHGYHHDIKPRNILIKDKRLILADFGLARLKDVQEDTQTPWKHTPPTYAAPEARDPDTLQERDVGRAYDVWSFGCVLGEFATYCLEGANSVRAFRKARIVEGTYGSHNCFHHNGSINPAVHNWYHKMKDTYKSSYRSLLFDTSSWLLIIDPTQRPTSSELVQSFNSSSLSRWMLSITSQTDFESSEVSERLPPVYQTKLTLERNRLRAWGYSHGLKPFAEQAQATVPDLSEQYDRMVHLLKSCSVKLANLLPLHYNDADAQEQVLQVITSTNDALFLGTSQSLKNTIENTFQLLTISAPKTVKLLADNRNTTALEGGDSFLRNDQDTPQSQEIGLLAAARYASLMLSSSDSLVSKGAVTMIDPALLSAINQPFTYASRLEPRWYYHGFREVDKQKVLVEERSYAGTWTTTANEQNFADIGKEVLARLQELAQLFQMRSKPRHMRILQSLGAYHLPSLQRFGYVYEFPHNRSDAEPVSLATIIRETKDPTKNPTLNDKFALAQAVTLCIHSLHMTGWVHKDICTSNLIFLRDPGQELTKVDLTQVYLTGFQHSRQLAQGAYSDGAYSTQDKTFIHPAYLKMGNGFHSAFDYYALGVVLLEIALWRTADKLFVPSFPPDQTSRILLDYAQKYIPSRMGTGYCKVVLACMRFYDKHRDEEGAPDQLHAFQEEILEELHRCSLPLYIGE